MRIISIDDPDDPRIAAYRDIRERDLTGREGLFIAEGELVIDRALREGYRPRSALLAPRWLDALLPLLADAAPDLPVYLADPEVLERVTGFHVHRGALAAFERKPLPEPAALLAGARRVVVVENVNNPTNLGALLRSAAALGMDAGDHRLDVLRRGSGGHHDDH